MLNKLYSVFLLIFSFLFFSCRTYKPVSNVVVTGRPDADYINTYKHIAISEMKRTGVPASITLAQGMIESNFGKSTLSREANNHFGIKCHNGWTGATVRHDDDRRNECFRKYKSPEESFRDHSDFLRTGSRYRFLFDLSPYDYEGWARGLKKAGYATNPEYASMLIRKIEENNLTLYDMEAIAGTKPQKKSSVVNPVAGQSLINEANITASSEILPSREPRINENNRIQYIIVKDGETREDIEREFNLLKWELSRYNELEADFKPVPGQVLYLQPKRDKAETGKNTCAFSDGDTMYMISQKYGIKLKSLYEMNRLEFGTQPEPGTTIWLRSVKPVN